METKDVILISICVVVFITVLAYQYSQRTRLPLDYWRANEAYSTTDSDKVTMLEGGYTCKKPYFGENCEFIDWDRRFYALGNSDIVEFKYKDEGYRNKTWDGDGKFDKESCSVLSDTNPGSSGFMYSLGRCYVITSEVSAKDVTYTGDAVHDSGVYLKEDYTPIIHGSVIVTRNRNDRRFYSNDNPDSVIIKPGVVTKVPFQPASIYNVSKLKGVWSRQEFSAEQYEDVRSTAYRDNGLDLYPYHLDRLLADEYWVMYK